MRRMDYSRGKKKNVTENVTGVSRLLPDETAHTISRKYQLFKQVGICLLPCLPRPTWIFFCRQPCSIMFRRISSIYASPALPLLWIVQPFITSHFALSEIFVSGGVRNGSPYMMVSILWTALKWPNMTQSSRHKGKNRRDDFCHDPGRC